LDIKSLVHIDYQIHHIRDQIEPSLPREKTHSCHHAFIEADNHIAGLTL